MVLKLTCKMSGFRSGKVRSGEQRERHRGRRATSVPGGSCQEEMWRKTSSGCPPASLGEHDDGAGAALEGSLNSADGDGLRGVTGQMSDATQLLEHLSVEHGGFCFTGNLDGCRKNENLGSLREVWVSQKPKRALESLRPHPYMNETADVKLTASS